MAIKGASVAYVVVGGVLVYSGIKGSSISSTVKSVLAGNVNVTNTEPLTQVSATSADSGAAGSPSSATSGSGSANYLTIGKYLVANGYFPAAAAGIVGCIAGESGGNPESSGSGGDGLIAWTPPSTGPKLTGNATADLQTQLPAIIAYNNAQGQGLISRLNQITDPVQAADFYSENFERPLVKDSDVRASVATAVYQQLAGG